LSEEGDALPKAAIAEALLQDPLTEVTRRERRNLLAISVLAMVIVHAGIIPTRLSALGVEFGRADQRRLLLILSLAVLYFLVAFVLYAFSDFLAWRIGVLNTEAEQAHSGAAIIRGMRKIGDAQYRRAAASRVFRGSWPRLLVRLGARPVPIVRAAFDFGLPVLAGVYALVILWTTDVVAVAATQPS